MLGKPLLMPLGRPCLYYYRGALGHEPIQIDAVEEEEGQWGSSHDSYCRREGEEEEMAEGPTTTTQGP